MRKIFLFTALLVSSCLLLKAQDFKVIHVNGNIVAQSTQKVLTRGSAFGEKEKFQYESKSARAVVINTKVGKRYILKGETGDVSFHHANLTPSAGNISSRAGGLNNRLDLKNQFDGKFVILGELKLVINSSAFPMNKNQFFYISYSYKGEPKPINKRLYYSGDTLFINKDSLLRVDGKPILNEDITDMKLIYYSKKNGEVYASEISSTLYPVFPDENILKEEVQIIVESMPSSSQSDIVNAIASYISDVYGKPDKGNVLEWFTNEF